MKNKIFDNSNLAESYSGVTTPLTFSFAQYVYQEVYKSFCKMMGVSKKVINNNDDMFREMVVFIGNRMYYDLINWYKLISFLPGYKFNKTFLEKMLGVEKTYDYKDKKKYSFQQKYLWDMPVLFWQIVKILFTFIFMRGLVNRFNNDFDFTYRKVEEINLSKQSNKKLKIIYKKLENNLTKKWKIPIANDLAVMVSTGLADKLFSKWSKDDNIYNLLHMKSHSSLVSIDPGRELLNISKIIKQDNNLYKLFLKNNSEIIYKKLKQRDNKVIKHMDDYLIKFGNRFPNELKLEAISLRENPIFFIELLKKNLTQGSSENSEVNIDFKNKKLDKLSWPRKIIMKLLIGWSACSINLREETRFKRTLIFGFARKVFLQLGSNLHNSGILENKRDILFLKVNEIFNLVDKNITFQEINHIIFTRKEKMEKWRHKELPRRIETESNFSEIEKKYYYENKINKVKEKLEGIVVSTNNRNSISGTTVVLNDFDPKADFNNKILVAKHTDPGWAIIFPLVKAIIVERGGMLSHAAIVARELKIPCIIGVEGAIKSINNNSRITMNLTNGIITHE